MSDFIPGDKPKFERYKDEVMFITNSVYYLY